MQDHSHKVIQIVPLKQIRLPASLKSPAPAQVRAHAAQMLKSGQLIPILIQPYTQTNDFAFELVDGELSYLAAQQLGWESIQALVMKYKPVK